MTDKITLELTLEELKTLDKYVELNDETKSVFDKIKVAYPQTKSPVEECYKDWWGKYPETGTWDSFDDTRWAGFQAGYEFAYAISTAKEVMEKVQKEQKEDSEWKSVALRFGEELVSIGPCGYYGFTAEEWYDWVVNTYEKLCDDTVNLLNKENLKKAQKRGERVHKDVERVVRESVKWCEEHPGKDPLDWVKPQTPEQVADGLKEAFREAVKQGLVSSADKPKDDFMDKMVAELKGQNLTDMIYDWWEDIFTVQSNDDMETSISDLVDRIEAWLPKEQSAAGSQNVYVECTVEGFNDCLTKIKRKLR